MRGGRRRRETIDQQLPAALRFSSSTEKREVLKLVDLIMGRLNLPDPQRRKPFSFDFSDHHRPPKSPDPFAKFLASKRHEDALRKDTTKQQNQNPSNSSRAPNYINTAGSANGGSRVPNTNTGTHIKFASNVETSSPPQVTSSSSSEAGISSSDIHKLQRLIKRAIAAGRLRSKCRKCGNSVPHCCEQTILEAVFSLPQPSNS